MGFRVEESGDKRGLGVVGGGGKGGVGGGRGGLILRLWEVGGGRILGRKV